ncbi:MAG: XRE family transcriptional regulator [Vibrio sp.]|uniref:XRE family transcriptional regulator n=1 Tax=Vibrio sp. TaxID=678 RepID=UPI003A88E74F
MKKVFKDLKFKDMLSLWISSKNISRKDLIIRLQRKYHNVFFGLDTITFSRWINGKSTPPLYKQLYIAKCLDINLQDVIRCLDVSMLKCPNSHAVIARGLVKELDYSLSALSYNHMPKNIITEISDHSYDEHIELFGAFYGNLSPLKSFTNSLYEMRNKITYKSILIKNNQDEVIGHWAGIMNIAKINNLSSFISIPQNEVESSCLGYLGYYSNSKHYFELITQSICMYLILYSKSKDFVYFFIVDNNALVKFCTIIFNAEVIKYYPSLEGQGTMGVYLLKFNIIKSIANPLLLPKVQEKLSCLETCDSKNCKLCNLRDLELRKGKK